MKTDKKAVVILSGGMDSTLATFIAKNDGYEIIAVHFNYGQRTEQKELESFRAICDYLNIEQRYEIDIPFFTQIGASALTDNTIDIPTGGIEDGVPVTYVPFRNGIFLSIATAVGEKHKAQALFIGVVQEDSSGYPDCTNSFIEKMEACMDEGTKEDTKLKIVTPLVDLSKEEIVTKAIKLNVPLELTWSCYSSQTEACGVCDSCRLRLKGFKLAGYEDKINYSKAEQNG